MKKLLFFALIGALAFACSNDDDDEALSTTITSVNISKKNLELHYDDTFSIVVRHRPATLAAPAYEWHSSNPDIAEISQEGMLRAKKVGQTIITAETSNGAFSTGTTVTVNPYMNFFREPATDWTFTPEDLLAWEQRELLGAESFLMTFKGENPQIQGIIYLFLDEEAEEVVVEQTLGLVLVVFDPTPKTTADCRIFFAERYPVLERIEDPEYSEEVIFYQGGDDVIIALEIVESECMAIYMSSEVYGALFEGPRSATDNSDRMQQFRNQIKELKSKASLPL